MPGFKTVKSLNLTHVGVPSFSFGVGLGSVTSSSLVFFKGISFGLSDLDRQIDCARILSSLGSVLVHSFATTVLFYLSVAF